MKQQPDSVHWRASDRSAMLLLGDSLELLRRLADRSVDLVFADPPYLLSNDGTTCQGGERVKVNKGRWDRTKGETRDNHRWNKAWLSECRRVLKPNGSIWVSGTQHVIYSVGHAMQTLGYHVINDIAWEKHNPPPNLGCRSFTHDHETLIWAARSRFDCTYHFAYEAMKEANGGKQMKSVWRLAAPGKGEKKHGKHPTQKPEELLERIVAASCPEGGTVLDPFNGSGTTGVAALRLARKYIGIDQDAQWLDVSLARFKDVRPNLG